MGQHAGQNRTLTSPGNPVFSTLGKGCGMRGETNTGKRQPSLSERTSPPRPRPLHPPLGPCDLLPRPAPALLALPSPTSGSDLGASLGATCSLSFLLASGAAFQSLPPDPPPLSPPSPSWWPRNAVLLIERFTAATWMSLSPPGRRSQRKSALVVEH